jgi:hypothetical protein
MRPFTTNNIKKCDKFKSKVRELYETSNIFNIVENLDQRFKKAQGDEINKVIEDCIKYGNTASELLICAGKQICTKAYKNSKPYSDKLAKAAKHFHNQQNLLRFLTVQKHNSITKQEEAVKINQIKHAHTELWCIQSEATKITKEFLNRLAKKRAAEWNLSAKAALHTIIQAESSKHTFAGHGHVMKGGKKGSIKNVVVAIPKYGSNKESIYSTRPAFFVFIFPRTLCPREDKYKK